MAKNFELLQRAGQEDLFSKPDQTVPLPRATPSVLPLRKELSSNQEITKLVQRLFLQGGPAAAPQIVSFCGWACDERSSWICASAGQTLAEQVNSPVCIVDANFCSPQLHLCLNSENRIGLSDALATAGPIQDFETPLLSGNLWLISSGAAKANFHAPLERYRERFAELRQTFSYILVSGPSLQQETEAALIGQLADGVVLIVEANQSRRDTMRRAKQQLESSRVKLLGAVLDQRGYPIPETIYRWL